MKCRKCNGEGELLVHDGKARKLYFTVCEVCHGTGKSMFWTRLKGQIDKVTGRREWKG